MIIDLKFCGYSPSHRFLYFIDRIGRLWVAYRHPSYNFAYNCCYTCNVGLASNKRSLQLVKLSNGHVYYAKRIIIYAITKIGFGSDAPKFVPKKSKLVEFHANRSKRRADPRPEPDN